MEEICESKRCRQLSNPAQAPPPGFDPTAWAAVYKLSVFVTAQLSTVSAAFNEFDLDNSGEIDVHEFAALLKRIGAELETHEVEAICSQFDLNNDGRIQYQELMASFGAGPLVEASFPDVVIHWLTEKYGMKGLVDQYAWDLLCNVECARHDHRMIDLFGGFLEQQLDMADLVFFLFARSLVPHGVMYEFSSRREVGAPVKASAAKSSISDPKVRTPAKYLPYEMVPGELDRQENLTAEQSHPHPSEKPELGADADVPVMSAAVCVSICKRLVRAHSCLDIDDFLEFIDAAFVDGELDLETPLIDIAEFLHFATHHYHSAKGSDSTAGDTATEEGEVEHTPVDPAMARNEIANAVLLLRREVERRIARVDVLKHQLQEEKAKHEQAEPSEGFKGKVEFLANEIRVLNGEVASRVRMLSTLGVSDVEIGQLMENKFCDYIRERSHTQKSGT